MVQIALSNERNVVVKGKVLLKDDTRGYVLVEDESRETLWIVDTLDDSGVSLDYLQLRTLIPHIQEWMNQYQSR